ncbi:ABC transporter substrate-binding protein [Carboxylicivirga sp. A043]|uniref:ABC transporter substrate-binding protein n=1 Tax=Carboxylicivirga litoralis TaxID=2816963 RepID=UPI0021CB52AC|nr:ABC transporter substrate-binding protein [Carboxylicivirga sp. A043]MCU4155381.1 ABC transporter substrate-binding protein [Carboxylicivirga sp. A043]
MKAALKLILYIYVFFICVSAAGMQVPDTVVLQLKWKHQFQFAGFYAAIEQGYYKDAGIAVVVKEGSTSINFVEEVISGRADFGLESSKLIIARNQNQPVVALAAIFQHSPEILLTRKDKGIRYIEDMEGMRISIGQNGLASPVALLNKFNISKDTYSYGSNVGYINDLINDSTDVISAYITDSPFQLEQAGIDPLVFKPRSYGIDLYGDVLFTSQQMVEDNKGLTEGFVKASIKGWVYAMDNKEELINLIINKYNPELDKKLLVYEATQMEDLVMPKLIEPGHMNPDRWTYIADTFVEIGLLHPLYSLDGFLFEDYQLFNNRRTKKLLFILLGVVILSLISLLIFFLFNRRLKKAVLQRTEQLSALNYSLKKEINKSQIAHANLTLSEERFKLLFEDSPISLWEEDFSAAKQMVDELKNSGVNDVEHYIRSNPDFIKQCARVIKINNINKATIQYLEADNKADILNNIDKIFNEKALLDITEEIISFCNGKMIYETESEHMTLKGNKIYVSITVKIPYGHENSWSKVIVSLINITDLRQTTDELKIKEVLLRQQNEALKGINEELKKSKLKAEESDRLKTAFLSNMSHEIRTPMNGIVGFTDLLKDETIEKTDRVRYLDIIEENSQQLLRIISDIIDISKIEASQLKIVKNEIDINQLFERLLAIFQLRLKRLDKEHITCCYNIDASLADSTLIITSDITRLRQILTNLLENAAKFTEHGSIEFGVYPANDKNSLIFYVKDTGVGIKRERVAQIFERFFREEERFGANLGGTGLGLSIAKNLVELLGGSISVESEPGKGANFYFTHPYNN